MTIIIKSSIRSNFFTNAHPLGIMKNIETQIKNVSTFDSFKGPKNVLIIGGSSGYGLASRISLAYGAQANTINISFEKEASNRQSGSAGYWNNVFFRHFVKNMKQTHMDFNGDAFSFDMKQKVVDYIKSEFGQIDLLVYSLASGVRKNEDTGINVRSQIKPLNQSATGKTIDIAHLKVVDLTIEPANEQDIEDTVFVMGGSDWKDWVDFLDKNKLLAPGFKTIAYTYIGGANTNDIYRNGTIGKAKEDLENTANLMHQLIRKKYQGEALISSSKAVVSKASVFIPQMPVYVACLFDVMKSHGVHETILEHKYRLFKDMVYGDARIVDDKKRIRLDHKEMDKHIQEETQSLMLSLDDQGILELDGTKAFLKEFYEINGFDVDLIDYEQDVDLNKLKETYAPDDYSF